MGSRLEQKSTLVRKRIENHHFDNEGGEEYEGSAFGGFSEYFRRKKIKLQNLDAELRAQSEDKPQIFRGVVCHVNGYTQPSLNDLHTMVVQHGGGFIQYLDGKTMVTHIIAANLTPKKKEEFRKYRIVKPAWIVDSVKAGKLLPWDNYRVVDEGVGQKVLGFKDGSVVSQANRRVDTYKEQTAASWYTEQLQALTPGRHSSFTQTITPTEEIDEDRYSTPEITSSIEQALGDAREDVVVDHATEEISAPQSLLEVRTELGTPPPSSPAGDLEVVADQSREDLNGETPDLRPREGSQEPDYSMAVVRDSKVLRSVSLSKLAKMTAEEHNALLLSDPKIRKSTVVNPDFLEQYYRESRLHHLSTWKADLKSQLQALASEKSSSQKHKFNKLPGQRRYVMHVDFDSFFAAVSLKRYPQYKDKPAVVAHGNGSGSEIASCNYPARKYGISNGMWMRRAQDLCPEVKILPYDFPGYEAASRKFYDAILATGGVVQSVSIDEALVDISAICFEASASDGIKRNEGAVHREELRADQLAQELRDEVLRQTGCAVSVGIGGNILLAKVALRRAKPAGQFQLKPEGVLDFIGKLEVQNLPGVAWSIGGKLEEIGIKLVKDIREVTKERLINALGPKTGEKIWDYSRGIDRTEVGDRVIRKSVSAEVNWGVRFETQDQVDEFMYGLCGELHKRLLKERVRGKQLTMKVMRRAADAPLDPPKHLGHGKCDTFNKSMQLGVATHDPTVIAKEATAMLKSFGISPGELRGIGVQMQKLEQLKSGHEGAVESSQRRLQFKLGQASTSTAARKPPVLPTTESIEDDVKTPEKARIVEANKPSIEVKPVNLGTPTKKALNTLGTQFVLPTQVDHSVLAELPPDIQARLARHIQSHEKLPPVGQFTEDDPALVSRAQSPAVALPTQSQLDPGILEALPDDIRAEVLDFYKTSSHKRGGQAVLPQSPRKVRTLPSIKQPFKRKRGGGTFSTKGRGVVHNGDVPTLTQANFVSRPMTKHLQEDAAAATDTDGELEELDPEYLAALPDDIRAEVLAQQRQARLQRTGGIDLSLHQRPRAQRRMERKAGEEQGSMDRLLQLSPRPPPPTFTPRKLSTLPALRDAVKAWVEEFSDEGPYGEDVEALIRYLQEVVKDERDLQKATAIVRWMGWLVEDGVMLVGNVKVLWMQALRKVKEGVQAALSDRGLGNVDLG